MTRDEARIIIATVSVMTKPTGEDLRKFKEALRLLSTILPPQQG